MQAAEISFYDWHRQFATDEQCMEYLVKMRWPEGFICPRCGQGRGYRLGERAVYECAACHHQSSVTAGTLLHATKLPLSKWLWAVYWVSSDKGGISALRLSKLLGVTWRTAFSMLRKLRGAMGGRDRLYRLEAHTIELDDAFIGGKRPGKRGRGAYGKTAVLVACEVREGHPRFAVMEALPALNHETVRDFAHRRLTPGQEIHTDALAALGSLIEAHQQVARNTPPALVKEWLPWVHILIANLKRFLLGTYHGITGRYVQEYLDEFLYRFNRRFWEPQLPHRLLRLCVEHAPIRLT